MENNDQYETCYICKEKHENPGKCKVRKPLEICHLCGLKHEYPGTCYI